MATLKLREPSAPDTVEPEPASYERDFYSWTVHQAAALRAGRLSALDSQNLAEEIEDLGRETFNKLSSIYRVILVHMLKWDHQPERRSRSWVGSIETQRLVMADLLGDNPSLKSRRQEAIGRAYRQARIRAAVETRRDKTAFPEACPYSLDEVMNRSFEWLER